MRLAIIPARGGSKRIPRKNIREFCGKPIIAYSIEAALDSECFDEVIVSTDDVEIAELASRYGAGVPFLRTPQTASDHATTADVLIEVLDTYEKLDVHPELICCIYPTAPFVSADSLRQGLTLMLERAEVQAVLPVTAFSYPIQRALRRTDDGMLILFQPEYAQTRSQDLAPAYHDAGQFYWLRVPHFLATRYIIGPGAAGLVLPDERVQDIDNESDWRLAELKYKFLQERRATSP